MSLQRTLIFFRLASETSRGGGVPLASVVRLQHVDTHGGTSNTHTARMLAPERKHNPSSELWQLAANNGGMCLPIALCHAIYCAGTRGLWVRCAEISTAFGSRPSRLCLNRLLRQAGCRPASCVVVAFFKRGAFHMRGIMNSIRLLQLPKTIQFGFLIERPLRRRDRAFVAQRRPVARSFIGSGCI
jgi:hypothetical protein